jgi:hypothetical protein
MDSRLKSLKDNVLEVIEIMYPDTPFSSKDIMAQMDAAATLSTVSSTLCTLVTKGYLVRIKTGKPTLYARHKQEETLKEQLETEVDDDTYVPISEYITYEVMGKSIHRRMQEQDRTIYKLEEDILNLQNHVIELQKTISEKTRQIESLNAKITKSNIEPKPSASTVKLGDIARIVDSDKTNKP